MIVLLASIAVFALVVAALALPLLRRPRLAAAPAADPLADDLVEVREAALHALRELEFDHAVGKLAEDDYHALRDRYERRALALLKATDPEQGAGGAPVVPTAPADGRPAPLAQVPLPRLNPVLGRGAAGGQVAVSPKLAPSSHVATHRNGKDHSLAAVPVPTAARPAMARPPRVTRGQRAAVATAAVAGLFVAGVAGIYFASSQAQGDQRVVARLEGVGPRGLALAPAGRAFLASAAGLWTSGDGGSGWQALEALDGALRAVAVSAARPSRVYAVGPGLMARSDDGGRGWAQQPAALGELFPADGLPATEIVRGPADLRALAVDPGAPDRLWVVVEGAGLFRSDDGGQSWTLRSSAPPANATALAVVPGDAVREGAVPLLFLGSATEGVLASADEGASWAPASGVLNGALPTRRVSSLAFDAESGESATTPDGRTLRGSLYAGTDQGLFKSIDRGQSWARLPLAAAVAAVGVAPSDARLLLAADREGRVYRSRNRGVTWDGS